jgi:hypothetical protein
MTAACGRLRNRLAHLAAAREAFGGVQEPRCRPSRRMREEETATASRPVRHRPAKRARRSTFAATRADEARSPRCSSASAARSRARRLHRPNHAVVGTLRADGSPHTVPSWYDWEEGRALLSLDESRLRLGFIRRDPGVALTVLDMSTGLGM